MSPIKRLGGLFYQSNNLKQAVGILFVTVLISNALGLVRNVIIANRVGVTFGTIGPLDNYYAAFVLPDLLYNIIIVGALSSAILPLLVTIDTEGNQKKFWQTFNVLLTTGFVVVLAGLVILYFVLPSLVPVLFPGFSSQDTEFTTQLSRVLLLSPLFFTVSQLSTSALQAKKFFFAPALAPLVYNLAIISAALAIPRYGLSVLVFGVVLGAVCHFLVQLPTLFRLGWRYSFELGFKNEHVRRVMRLMVPRTIALTSTQLLLIAFYHLASNLNEGSIAIYRLTDDLQTAPVLLLANTLAMAILPDFTRHIAKENQAEFTELVGKALRLLIFIFVPATLFLLIFRWPIISLYIEIGHSISETETMEAVRTFAGFVISLLFQGWVLLLARAYFARSDTVRPTVFSLVSLAVAWVTATLIAKNELMGVSGLSIAFSIGSALNALLLWFGLGLPASVIWRDSEGRENLMPILTGAIIFTLAVFLIKRLGYALSAQFTSPSSENLMIIIAGLIVGTLVYLGWAKAKNLEQWRLIRARGGG